MSSRAAGDVDAELGELGGEVVEHPLLEDLVVADDAVGDHPGVDFAAGRWPPAPVPGVVTDVQGAVRRDEALHVVAGPDHLVGVVAHVREGADPLDRAGHHRLDAVPRSAVVVYPATRRVRVVDVADVLVFPDAVGDAHDVVDDVDVRVLEAAHRVTSRAAVDARLPSPVADLEGDREVGGHHPLDRSTCRPGCAARDSGGGTVRCRPLRHDQFRRLSLGDVGLRASGINRSPACR